MTRDLSLSRILASLPHGSQPFVRALGEAAQGAGSRVYLVGGPVRDILLERPIRDLDLLVAPGTETMGIARAAAPQGARLVEYGRFGTLRMETGDLTIDIASARSETYARPGALPTVEPASLEDDLRRRDFSVNALAIPLDADSGRTALPIEDPCGGLADLGERNLRVLHSRSFHDDPTRILRAARLAPRLGFKLPRATRSALRDALRDGALGAVSGDRLRREFEKLFADASLGLDPSLALRNLGNWHVLGALEPGFEWPKAAVTPIRRLGRTIAEPQWRQNRNRPWVSGLALCLAPLRPALRRRVLQRFAVRGEAADRIANFGRDRDRLLAALAKARGRGAVDGLLGGIHEETLLALFASAQPPARGRVLRWAAEDRGRRAPLSGEDLIAMGLEGPSVGKVLARIRVAHLDGAIANREEAAALAVEWVRRRGTKARTRNKK